MLKPHFVKPDAIAEAAHYAEILRTDVSTQIAALMPIGKQWYSKQDLASPRAAATTRQCPADHAVALVPWMPGGADCSPLDIFVNPELKRPPRGRDMSAQTKIMGSCAGAIAEMSADSAIKEPLEKC